MDNFEKRQAVVAELVRDAARSDRLIAQTLGSVSSGLVEVRKKLEQEGKLEPGKPRASRPRKTPRPSTEALLTILGSLATGEITAGEASLLLGKVAVQPGTTMPEILEAVATGELLPAEATVLVEGDRSPPDAPPRSFQ